MRTNSTKGKQSGFSLIELLIVVAIILILAAIAIPSLMKSKISANEASAVACLRDINTAQTTYQITYPTYGYSDTLAKLAYPTSGGVIDQNAAGLLDWVLGCPNQPCPKSGYMYMITNTSGMPITTYSLQSYPAALGQTGIKGFCSNQLANMTYDPNGGTNCTNALQ